MNTMALTFDTLQYAKKLQKAGFTEEQAEIQAEILHEQTNAINNFIDDNVATKQDLKILRQDLVTLEERLNNRINEMGYQITIRLGSMIAGAVVILGILIPLMSKFLR